MSLANAASRSSGANAARLTSTSMQCRHYQGHQPGTDHQLAQLAGHLSGLRGVGDQDQSRTIRQGVYRRRGGRIRRWSGRRSPRWRGRRRRGAMRTLVPPGRNQGRRAGQRRDGGARGGVRADVGVPVGSTVGCHQQRAHAAAVDLGGDQFRRGAHRGQRVGARGGRQQQIVQIPPSLQAQADVDGHTQHHQ